ncbi:MAG: pirin family protein, partial [Bacteroidota bacterium]
DDQGHKSVIRPNDVQVMSAGTGIVHSEHNNSADEPVNLLQIWILPQAQAVSPRYAQYTFDPSTWHNQVAPLVTSQQQGGKLWINQQAVIARTSLEPGKVVNYPLQSSDHGVYIFVMEGQVKVEGEVLNRRDAIGIEEVNQLALQGVELCDVLLIEVPMQGPVA